MGFGIKNNIDLDLTYNKIIKPCILKNNLIPFPLYKEEKYNAFRCDEISGTTSIDYKFVTCLNGADIVIADISTMNNNAIYELGARHALKPRSTILLCAKEKANDFKFFDITYVPIIFYDHNGLNLDNSVVKETKRKLNDLIEFCINSTSSLPDNPIYRALLEKKEYDKLDYKSEKESSYSLYNRSRKKLDDNKYEEALPLLEELYHSNPSEENLLLLALCQYKISESKKSCKSLIDCLNFILDNIDIDTCCSEKVFGRLAAISLRIYNLSKDAEYYYCALKYYRKGAEYSSINLYCPRNYCALLFRIHEITDDPNIILEYYFTAKHYAKLFVNSAASATKNGSYEQKLYYFYNKNDLNAIISGDYNRCLTSLDRLNDNDVSPRQVKTVKEGVHKLSEDIKKMEELVKPS